MLKITTRVVEPEPEPDSFGAQAKTIWRAGTKYARIAESPDPGNRIHGLVIINEPDAWMINLSEKSGKHVVDPGPSLDVHIPIFQTPSEVKMKLKDLEFGKELEFFNESDAKRSPGEVINGKPTHRYEVIVNGRKLVLWVDATSKAPLRVSMVKGLEAHTIEYLAYETLPFEPSLFRPPAGVAIENSR